ncbi:UvrD-helicase domain-containing protein [Bradyrhizobium sp. AUGA SZCCT0274]|uniref:UvrD-helicase domain-containing protein n=1 Tax=Bradyrhizobium sp. AUGA SZCCT0274 TaxID=2807670 RepID=UPI001BA66180|nr:UvrD-helicase domain-containing protein [Bradyrhizobium sp. AUGA SZCCT0274]MBR1240256.1 UvrD-helicase domain-containing protein [Bradyrhizobium sp. AUGA SZCCT0274]
MTKEWTPSWLGRRLTGSPEWRLLRNGFELSLTATGQSHCINVEDETSYRVQRGYFWTDITLHPGQACEVQVDGLPNFQGARLISALAAEKQIRQDVAFLQRSQRSMSEWLRQKVTRERAAEVERRWLTHEMQMAMEAARPAIDVSTFRACLNKPEVRIRLGVEAAALDESLTLWEANHRAFWSKLNALRTERELEACKDLFDKVESKPLTEEQARAVVCFDNRMQVVASAGSGKTSTMVAKAAYAIHRGFVAPERIILLAFNKQAAVELKERAAKSFKRLGMEGISVEASTFHALGLRIIGKATGEKPDIPDWATDAASGIRKLADIVDQLKDRSLAFRTQWDLFRFVFGRGLPPFGSSGSADVWDEQGNGRALTYDGTRVRSREEAILADWLFYNGVEYRYEEPYKYNTADEDHRQYRPDFYYPAIDLYHEHFALDAQGEPPPEFAGYLEGVKWKRQLHSERGTALIETTSHQIRSGEVFEHLARELTLRGFKLDPNPDREVPIGDRRPMEPAELIGLIRTFISHAKSNCLTIPEIRQRLDSMPKEDFKHRYRMFLNIAAQIIEAWDAALSAEGGIDFEDMLNLAATHLESGRYEAPYELIMADEFQDASRARARLCRALVQKPGRFFFAVGDDWQSINRFAGADVSVMTGFREWFGHGQILKLEQTFRCPQALCDVSSQFVSKNDAQISKKVRSATPAVGPVLQAFQVDHREKLAYAIGRFVERLSQGVMDGSIPPGRNGKVTVYVLGRYNADRQYVPDSRGRFERWVDVSFVTIHRSKGSEADYVILPEMLSAPRGRSFPNTRADDPVLALAMPAGDDYPLGEERRLFYVALTRARRSVVMFTARGQCSHFLRELEADGAVAITDTDGKAVREEGCPSCKQGVLILRSGPYGEFRSCSNFPVCRYKPKGHRRHDLEVR